MYLKRIEIQGFKSFAEKTILEFGNGITTVVGPNGSGKSNVVDSIRWVLGEQSAKMLRGSKMEDVIFAGTQNRKPVSFAEVSIVIDNCVKILPIEYSEVTITRRVYRSAESEYYINKTQCRLKDIQELFMDTGIGRDGYSIISQGKIDEILSSKSEDRRNIFEEAAGIVKYRARKQEAEKKLDNTNTNIEKITFVLDEIENNLDNLELQSQKAKKYLELRDSLRALESGLFLHNVNKWQSQLDESSKEFNIANEEIKEAEKKLEALEEEKKETKENIENLSNKLESLQENYYNFKNEEEKNNSEIKIIDEKIENNKENIVRFASEIDLDKNKIELLKKEKLDKSSRRETLIASKKKFEIELEEKQNELNEIVSSMNSKEIEIEEEKKKVNNNNEEISKERSNIAVEKNNIENIEKRLLQIDNEKLKNISTSDSEKLEKEELYSKAKEYFKNLNNLEKEIKEIEAKYNPNKEKLDILTNEISKLTNDINVKTERKKLLTNIENDNEGYIRSVKAILDQAKISNSFSKGMHGTVASNIVVDSKYEIAIEIALGASMQNIIVDSENEAKNLIQYLKSNNLGRATFLPISNIKVNKIENISKISKMQGFIGVANDIISYDSKYEKIFSNLLGRTVIIDNIDNATKIAKEIGYIFKIVTLEGDIISSAGAMTGGSVKNNYSNLIGRKREIEVLQNEIAKLNDKLDKSKIETELCTKEVEQHITFLNTKQEEHKQISMQYEIYNQKVIMIQNNINKFDSYINRAHDEKSELLKSKEDSIKNINNCENTIEKLSKINEELLKVIEDFARYNKDKQILVDNLNEDIVNLKISLTSFDESMSSSEEIFARIEEDIERYNLDIERKQLLISSLEKEISDKKNQKEKIEYDINHRDLRLKELLENIEKVKEDKADRLNKLDIIEKTVENIYKTIDAVRDTRNKLENKKIKYELEIENLKNRMWEEYEITMSVAEDYQKRGLMVIENISQSNKESEKIKRQIKDLGSINIDSIQEYKEAKERYEFMSSQRNDLEETSTKLKKLISDMTHIMKDQFANQFKIINKNFNEAFTKLFGGGKAELCISDQNNILESGIDIEVQPPGKKLQNMMLLSGGERALTAIALLFAILELKASPFCVLDEIEAALDDVNVYRFSEYIKDYSDKSQFIVITHRKGTMEVSDTIYGVTMQEYGVSKLVSMEMKR